MSKGGSRRIDFLDEEEEEDGELFDLVDEEEYQFVFLFLFLFLFLFFFVFVFLFFISF